MADHIPYIHNYCDRWCERCTMTSRCAIYVPNQTGQSEETTEEENENLWKSVAENLAIATKLITEEIERRGINESRNTSFLYFLYQYQEQASSIWYI